MPSVSSPTDSLHPVSHFHPCAYTSLPAAQHPADPSKFVLASHHCTPMHESPRTPSASGGSTAGFVQPFPCMGSWASKHDSPSTNSLMDSPVHSNADTSGFANMQGLHALRASFNSRSLSSIPNISMPFHIPSVNASLKASGELPEASDTPPLSTSSRYSTEAADAPESYGYTPKSAFLGSKGQCLHANLSEPASHALLGNSASALLGFSPSVPSHEDRGPARNLDGMPSVACLPYMFDVSAGHSMASSRASAAGTPSESLGADILTELKNSLLFDKLASECVLQHTDSPYSEMSGLMDLPECDLSEFDAPRLCGSMFFDG